MQIQTLDARSTITDGRGRSPAMVSRLQWTAPSGDVVDLGRIDGDLVRALVTIDRLFPGARSVAWRRQKGDQWTDPQRSINGAQRAREIARALNGATTNKGHQCE